MSLETHRKENYRMTGNKRNPIAPGFVLRCTDWIYFESVEGEGDPEEGTKQLSARPVPEKGKIQVTFNTPTGK